MNASLKPNLSKRKLHSIQSELSQAHSNYADTLFRRALYKTNNPEVSQDLVQTTFLKTLLYLQKGGKVDFMRSFLHHILNALIVDEYRKTKTTSLDILVEKGFDPGSDDYKRIADIIDGKKLVSLIPELPKKYELVIRSRYVKGLSLKEIASITAQSENTVAVQIHRGLAKVKKMYTGDEQQADYFIYADA